MTFDDANLAKLAAQLDEDFRRSHAHEWALTKLGPKASEGAHMSYEVRSRELEEDRLEAKTNLTPGGHMSLRLGLARIEAINPDEPGLRPPIGAQAGRRFKLAGIPLERIRFTTVKEENGVEYRWTYRNDEAMREGLSRD